jgi:hypothetical protein
LPAAASVMADGGDDDSNSDGGDSDGNDHRQQTPIN